MSAEEFRRSIEASLPLQAQHGMQMGAPGMYGAYGWGGLMGSTPAQGDDNGLAPQTSLTLGAVQEAGTERSASFRGSSFSRGQYAYPPQQLQQSYQTQTSYEEQHRMAEVAGGAHTSCMPSGGPAQQYPPPPYYQQGQQPAVQVELRPSAAPAISPSMGDATVMVQAAASPRNPYPGIPKMSATSHQRETSRFYSPHDTAATPPPGSTSNYRTGVAPLDIPVQQAAPAFSPNCDGAPGARLQEQVACERHARQQQPQPLVSPRYPQQIYQQYNGPGGYGPPASGKVVHMRRSEAWLKYIAYEGCLQVCMTELERSNDENARHFLSGAFAKLRSDLGIDGLLLTLVANAGAAAATGGMEVSCINDICWDDMEPVEKRLNAVAFANTTSSCYMRIRCQRLSLPAASLLQKMCCSKRVHITLPSFNGVAVHIGTSEGYCEPAAFPLDVTGAARAGMQAVVFPLETEHGQGTGPRQSPAPPPRQLDIRVEGPGGTVAEGSLSYQELWRLAMSREAVDEAHAGSVMGTTIEVQVAGRGAYQGKVAMVLLSVVRVRKEQANYELAQVAPDGGMLAGGGADAVGKHTLRANACSTYDTALAAALAASGCSRDKLLVAGPWEWLLGSFASAFGVRGWYCLLAHLRWVLKPGVATVSTPCLDVIAAEIRPLLEASLARHLTTHEATLLEGVKKAVEMLLEVAFENYYALGDDQRGAAGEAAAGCEATPGVATPRGTGQELPWRPSVLMSCFRLHKVMKDVFLPSDQDWLNMRFRIAAKKRWRFLEANAGCDTGRDQGCGGPAQRANGNVAAKPGSVSNAADALYKNAERMAAAIRSDLEFDIFLQKQPDLLPSALNLPRITAEEYMANFVEVLRNMLARCTPAVPSTAAVDLLVATAQLQRYLQETQLYLPRQHPGYLSAMDIWRPIVLAWIDASRRGLNGACARLEGEARHNALSTLARVDVAKMPGMIESIEGAVAPLVHEMLERTWSEVMLFERVVKNWPLFGPHLEAALCDVLRTVRGALGRICACASNAAVTQQHMLQLQQLHRQQQQPQQSPDTSPLMQHPMPHGHHRGASSQNPYAPGGPLSQGRANANGPPGMGMAPGAHCSPGHGPYHPQGMQGYGMQGGGGRDSPAVPMVPRMGAGDPWAAGGGGFPGGRNAVLLKEAVLLNSLKVLMVMVPSIEDIISKWCGGTATAPPGPPAQSQAPSPRMDAAAAAYDDDMAPHIGAQFAQVVKELRTTYAEGVAATASRMTDHIRAQQACNLKAALNTPLPMRHPAGHAQHGDFGTGGYGGVSALTAQRDFVEGLMRPILAACDEALQALRVALDPRVFVATGRAVWDCMGKDLFEFVHFLQEGIDNRGAWRLRQHAHLALTQLCDFFRARLAASMEHCVGERDLDLPIHCDKAQKLLAQNTAVTNITLNPI